MRRKYFYLMALSALTLGSCSNETDLFGSPDEKPTGEQVTFLFPGTAQGVVPYADAKLIANAEENKIETLDIYVFGADKLATDDPEYNPEYLLEDVIKLTPNTDGGLTVDGEAMKTTISLVGTNRKCLYFVANGAGQTALNDYELGVTNTLDFIKKQTTSLGTRLLKAPLLMTGRFTFKVDENDPKKDDLTPPEGGHSVTLDRRVARFDIKNDSEESTLEIEKILIKNARQGAYLFAFGDGDANAIPAILPTRPPYSGGFIPQLMELDFLSFPTANTGTTGSVFYVYPNAAGTIAAKDFTSFELKGRSSQSQEVMVQPVKMQKKQTGTPDETALLPINPNYRYTISILATGLANVEATITVKEWVVGEKVDVEAGFGQVKMTLTEDTPDDGIELKESKLLTVPSGATAAFGINVAADTEWEIVEKDAELTWMTITDRPVPGIDANTPGEVGKMFTLEITKANPSTEMREQVLHIRNVKRPSIVQTLTVQQVGNTTNGFKVEGEKLENNTLLFFGSADVTTLTLTLPDKITSFDATTGETWITLEKGTPVTRAIDGNLLKVSVAANDGDTEGDTERTGTFTIKVGQLEQIIEVKQAPRNLGSIVVNAAGLLAGNLTYKGADETKKSLLVRALTEWKVTTVYFANITDEKPIEGLTDEWITNGAIELKQAEVQTRTNYNGQYNFTPVANNTFIQRKAQMTVENIHDAKIKQTVTIFQEGKLETLTLEGTGYADDVLPFAADATTTVELTATTDKPGGTIKDLKVAASDEGWVTIEVVGDKITVTPDDGNNTYTARTSEVTVTMANANDKVFTVKQAGKAAPTFTVSGDGLAGNALSLVAAGVTAAEYTVLPDPAVYTGLTVVKSDDATNWLTLTSTDVATNDGKFTLTAGANDTGAERTATLTVTLPNALNTQVITVKQAAAVAPDPSFTVSGTGLTGTGSALGFAMANTLIDAKTFTVNVENAALTDLTIVQQAGTESWLTLVQTSLATDGTFTLAAVANPDQTERTATITISLTGVATPTVITVTQAKADDAPKTPSFTVTGKDLTAGSTTLAMANTVIAAETYTVALTNATADAVSVEKTGTDVDWLTLAHTAGEATFTLAATANDAADAPAREATITVKVAGAADHAITVTQAAATPTP